MRHQQIDSIQDLQDFKTNNNIKTQERKFLSQTGINWSTIGKGEKRNLFFDAPYSILACVCNIIYRSIYQVLPQHSPLDD